MELIFAGPKPALQPELPAGPALLWSKVRGWKPELKQDLAVSALNNYLKLPCQQQLIPWDHNVKPVVATCDIIGTSPSDVTEADQKKTVVSGDGHEEETPTKWVNKPSLIRNRRGSWVSLAWKREDWNVLLQTSERCSNGRWNLSSAAAENRTRMSKLEEMTLWLMRKKFPDSTTSSQWNRRLHKTVSSSSLEGLEKMLDGVLSDMFPW